MRVIDVLHDVAGRSSTELSQTISNVETVRDHLIRGLNIYHKDLNNRYLWPWRTKRMSLQTVENYTTGSVQVTSGSRTVAGSGTLWTVSMNRRLIRLDRDTQWHEILIVNSATEIILKEPYIGESGSSLSYKIWKKYYTLDQDVPHLSTVAMSQWPYKSGPIPRSEFDNSFASPDLSGIPRAWAWSGIDRATATYSAGTVSASINSKTLTGVSTAWLGNVSAGAKITVDSREYNVESVDSDTQITLVQKTLVAIDSGHSYTSEMSGRSQIVLSSTPSPAINLRIEYSKRTYNLLNDNDDLDIWDEYAGILVNVLYGYYIEKLSGDNAFNWLRVYEGQVKEAWRNIQEHSALEEIPRFSSRSYDG